MANRKPLTPRSMAAQIEGPESRPGYQEYISDPRNQDAAMEVALNIAGLFPLLSGLRLPGILQAAKRSADLVRAANKSDQYFRPDTPRPNSMYADEMVLRETPRLPAPEKPKQIPFDPNYRDPAFFGKRTTPDPRLVAEEEGFGSAAAALGERQNLSRQAERDFIRDQLAQMEGEGGTAPMNELLRRQINEAADRQFARDQLSMLEGEGGTTADAIELAKMMHNDRIAKEQALRDAEVARWEDEGGGMAHTTTPPVFTRDFTLGETIPMTHGIPQGRPYYGTLATRSRTETPEQGVSSRDLVALLQSPQAASSSNIPLFAALGLGGAGGIYGINQLYGNRAAASRPPVADRVSREDAAPQPQGRSVEIDPMTGLPVEGGGANYTGPAATRGAQLNPVEVARQVIAQRQAAKQEAPQERTRIDWGDPDRASDFFRASKQMQEAINAKKDIGYYGQGEKRGGPVEKKPDAVHKALEIIHHLVTR